MLKQAFGIAGLSFISMTGMLVVMELMLNQLGLAFTLSSALTSLANLVFICCTALAAALVTLYVFVREGADA